ncbi:hypothetical protein ACI784_04320 [Geodermatophilus sp. SYSU D01186]
MSPRWWRPVEETPDRATSRVVQAVLVLGILVLLGGVAALDEVRLSTPGIRPYLAAFLLAGAGLLVAVLARTERVRRHKRRSARPSRDE